MEELTSRWLAAHAAVLAAMEPGGDELSAELAVQDCLQAVLDHRYAALAAARPSATLLLTDLAERDARGASLLRRFLRAPDTRARLTFLRDLLAYACPEALT